MSTIPCRRELRRNMGFTHADFSKAADFMDVDEAALGEIFRFLGFVIRGCLLTTSCDHVGPSGSKKAMIPSNDRDRPPEYLPLSKHSSSRPGADAVDSDQEQRRLDMEDDEADQMALDEEYNSRKIAFGDPGSSPFLPSLVSCLTMRVISCLPGRDKGPGRKKTLWDLEDEYERENAEEDKEWEEQLMRKTGVIKGKKKAAMDDGASARPKGILGVVCYHFSLFFLFLVFFLIFLL